MLITQKNVLRKLSKEQFSVLKLLSSYSKNVYNQGLYNVVNYFDALGEHFTYQDNAFNLKGTYNYKMLLAQSSQQVLRIVDNSFRSFFGLLKARKRGKYRKPVHRPRYLKKDGYFLLVFTKQNCRIKNGFLEFSLSKSFRERHEPSFKTFKVKSPPFVNSKNIHQVRIIPKYNHFEIEYVYEPEDISKKLNKDNTLGIDIGLDNLATCVDCKSGRSFIVDGRKLKSYNRWYNKRIAGYQSRINKEGITFRTKFLKKLDDKRYWYINDYLNQVVNIIIKYCVKNDIGTIIIGYNKEWKQKINIGRVNNQNFVQIPHGSLHYKLQCKCERLGIDLVKQEESYTSKCSFIDNETIEKHEKYLGKRIVRGLFKTKKGNLINSDVNGACNIVRKSNQRFVYNERLGKGLTLNPERVRVDHAPSLTRYDTNLAIIG